VTRARTLANRALAAAWRRGLLPEPTFEAERLEAEALRKTGVSDFGPDHWRMPFTLLLQDLRGEARLNPLGQAMAFGQIRKILCDRLRAHDSWRRQPEIEQRPLAPPVIVLGHARSGTTRLQRLLACDPLFLNSRFYEVLDPIRSTPDRRPMQARLTLAALQAFNPALAAIHPTGAKMVEEQFGLFSFSFYGAQLEAQWRVPHFARWWQHADRTLVYPEFRRLLQTISWSRHDDPKRPWLLKAPQFTEDLEPLLAAFPGARLLCLHRDPAAVVASSASLAWNQMIVQSDAVDPHWVGREWLQKTAHRDASCREARRRHPHVRQLDLDYDEMTRDWRAEMRRIYAFLDRPFTHQVERHMSRYLAASKGQGFQRHRYRLQDFGLSEEAVRERLAG
jgi:Sulfotransferase family